MSLPVITDTWRVALEWENSDKGLHATNVMHFRGSSLTTATLVTAFDAHVTANMWCIETTDSKILEIDFTPLDGSSATFPYTPTPGSKYAGVQSAEEFVPQVAGILKLSTALRGRSYRGRLFLPWVAEGSQQSGILYEANRATAEAAWQAFLVAMAGDGADLVVASYKLATAADVVAIQLETHIGTQRRRNTR